MDAKLRELVRQRADNRCEYCTTAWLLDLNDEERLMLREMLQEAGEWP